MPNINELVTYLKSKNISFEQVNSNTIIFTLKFYDNAGRSHKEEIEVEGSDDILKARATNNRYPNFCPNRHINAGGYFCLGLKEDLDKKNPDEWLNTVRAFLEAQLYCEKYSVWPHNSFKEWSHGSAAIYQKLVEDDYEKFKSNSLGLTIDQLRVEEIVKSEKLFYHLYAKGKLILVGLKDKILNKRHSCICTPNALKQHLTIQSCSNKCSYIVYKVALNDYFRIQEDNKFWESLYQCQALECCKTMEDCKLKN